MKELQARIKQLERRHRQLHILLVVLLGAAFLLGLLVCNNVQ
jgi:hypothetical protein